MHHFKTVSFYLTIAVIAAVSFGCSKPKAITATKTSSSSVKSNYGSYSQPGRNIEPFNSDNVSGWNSKTFSIDYGSISELIKENYDKLLNDYIRRTNCQQVGSSSDSRTTDKQYECGELPFGDIIDNAKKRVITIDIDASSGESDGFEYNIEGKQVDYYLDREQYKGTVTVPHLDTMGNLAIETSKKFGDDLFLRFTPDGSNAKIDACLIIPGMRTYSDPVTLNGKLKKSILITSLKADVSILLNLGYMEFDSASVCASFALSFDPYGVPEFKLLSIDELKYKNLRHEGHSISVEANATGLLSFIQSITNMFGYNIEEEIEQKIQAKVEEKTNETMNIRKEDIRSGKWAAEFVDVAFAKSFIENYSDLIQDSMKDIGLGKVKVKDSIRAVCYAAINGTAISDSIKQPLVNICKLAPELKIDLFHVDQKSAQSGCYSYFFNPLQNEKANGTAKWWNDRCKLSTQIELDIDDLLKPSIDCAIDAINKRAWPVDHCSVQIQELIENYKDGSLDALMEQTEAVDFEFNDINLNRIHELLDEHFAQGSN